MGAELNYAFARLLGPEPATADILAFAATVAPDSLAFTGPGGGVSFERLHAQAAPLMAVFEAQGLGSEAAVGAAITPLLVQGGVAGADAGEATSRAIAEVRRAGLAIVGSDDLSSLPGVFRSIAARFPDRPAVTDQAGTTLSYRELDERSDVLATALIAGGAGSQTRIGISMARRVELIVALLGVMKTGAAYLPLDRSHPRARLSAIVEDARPLMVLTDSEASAEEWADVADRAEFEFRIATLADSIAGVAGEASVRLPVRISPSQCAYVIYTSGSTGTPKGVAVPHGALVSLLSSIGLEYGFRHSDVWSMSHSYAFDLSVGEIWTPLATGGKLVILDTDTTRDPAAFVEVLDHENVSIVNMTPSAFYQFASAVHGARRRPLPQSLRSVILVGEALDFEQVRRWYAERQIEGNGPGPELNNMYGPTEATVYMTRCRLTPELAAKRTGDIGAALSGSRVYVLDSRLSKVPDGVPGDLYIAGDQLALGYAGRFGLNSTRFVADPFGSPGDRMYLSGDVARFRDGVLEYLGRADDQVKLRGYRIELGEVEAALLATPGVEMAAAAVKKRPGIGDQLVGYVVGASLEGEARSGGAIRREAVARLPDYMVPEAVMVLDGLPLNVNGKLDRRALPDPVFESQVDYVPPASAIEVRLAAIFSEVLGIERVSVVESFHDIGGTSLLAARIVGRVSMELDVELNLRDLFEAPTIRQFAARAADAAPSLPPVTSVDPRPDHVPLSFAQQRMWFINRFDKSLPTYNIPVVLRLSGEVDVAALRAAMADAVERQDVLRTTFPSVDGVPHQLVWPVESIDSNLPWRVVDSDEEMRSAIAEGFDVAEEWPLRVVIRTVGPDELILAVVVHHIAADGESLFPLVSDVLQAYAARRDGHSPRFTPLPVQFADFALWQHAVLGSADASDSVLGRQLKYWRETLADLPEVLELPADRPRPAVASHTGAERDFTVPAEVVARIEAIARQLDVTPFMVVHASLAALLARLSASDDIAIAVPVAGRGQVALEHLVGMFVNTLVLRTVIDPGESFTDLVQRVGSADLDGFANADVPFESVVDALDPVRSESFAPLAQVMLSFDPAAEATRVDASVAGLQVARCEPPFVPAQVDLTFRLSTGAADGGWTGAVLYATDLFDAASAHRFAERFVDLLAQVSADPDITIGDVGVAGSVELSVLGEFSRGPVVSVPGGSVADLVAAGVAAVPDAVALVFGDREVSYAEFGVRVAALARELIAVGVGPDSAVGVWMDRSVELVVAVHAVVAAGGRYVPVDVQSPVQRAAVMLSAADAGVVLVAAGGVSVPVADLAGVRVVEVDAGGGVDWSVVPVTDVDRVSPLRADHGLYTLFTSGSTGVPKGVTVSHVAVANRLWWMAADYGLAGGERFFLKTPYTFDVSVWELFLPLVVGARLVIAAPDGHRDPEYLAGLIDERGVSVVHFVPSMLSVFVDVLGDRVGELSSLEVVFTSGEALAPAVAGRVLGYLPSVALVNLYGPTEAAVDVTASRVLPGVETVTIGRPVANTGAYVLDSRLGMVPVGVPGELYLAGVQVARGYAGQSALTAERFVADPFGSAGARLYRTGDLVRWNAAGELEYLGRNDFQVKLRGQRVELGEIEAVIAASPGVVHAAATVVESGAGGQYLVGYVSPASVELDVVGEYVAARLPEYMRPSVWVRLEDVVLSASGKLDRRALPEPDFESGGDEYVAPDGEAEEVVAAVVADLLGCEAVSVTSSFFELGGNSLAAMRLVARVSEALGVQVSVRDVFDAPSVRGLVAAVAGRSASLPPVTVVSPRPDRVPLSFAQQRMWFINRFAPQDATYNIPAVLRLVGELDVDALHEAVRDLVARHEILRTTFTAIDGVPHQVLHSAEVAGETVDWTVTDDDAVIVAAVTTGFDVTAQWPMRVALRRISNSEHVLAVVLHHIAADGESIRPLVTDLVTAYAARRQERAPEFEPLQVQFADFALWQQRNLGRNDDPESIVGRQLVYWQQNLTGLPDVLELPSDRPRPAVASGRGATVEFAIPGEVTSRVEDLAVDRNSTPFMVMHAALSVLLSRLSTSPDVAISTLIAGRGQAELDSLVGMFVNTVVLRMAVDGADSFIQTVDQAHRIDSEAFANAEVPFEAVVEAVDPVRSEAFAPLAQVSLTYRRASDEVDTRTIAGIDVTLEPIEEVPARRDLSIEVVADDGDWQGSIVFAVDLFDHSTIDEFAQRFVGLLDELTANPGQAVGDSNLLLAGEADLVGNGAPGRSAWTHGPSVRVNAPLTAVDLVAQAALRTPDATAVIAENAIWSYRDFAVRVTALAQTLITAGVRTDCAVGVCMDRSVEQYLAVHAIVAAGGQYVPIAPDYPEQRVREIVETAEISLLLVTSAVPRRTIVAAGVETLTIDSEEPVGAVTVERTVGVHPGNAAYTIFTSGSTGRPKGVVVTHEALVNMLNWFTESNGGGDHRFLLKAPFTFDASVWEFFGPVFVGAPVVIAAADGHRDPRYLARLIAEHAVTTVKFVPSVLAAFVDATVATDTSDLASLRRIFSGGEALTPALADRLRSQLPDAQVINQYGPTEAVVDITYEQVDDPTALITIGRPVWNSATYVLDERLHPVPVGVVGEMYLGGCQLSRGYAARPGETASTFIADPFGEPGRRLYRTGDLARWTPDGRLEYLGRTDFQVKLRGQRLELGEVEAVLASAPGVLLASADVATAPAGGEHLVAYITPETVDIDSVRDVARAALPVYMQPTVWIPVAKFSFTSSGKIDRKELPSPDFSVLDSEYVAPDGDAEEIVAAVFADLLGVDRVSVTESFFDIGGTSLSAMRLVARVSEVLGVEAAVRDVFDAPSVRELVAGLAGRETGTPLVEAVDPRPSRIPLSFAQQRMWFINRFDPSAATYNTSTVLRVSGALDARALFQALADVVVRHEILRTVFPAIDGIPYQLVMPADAVRDRIDSLWEEVDSEAGVESILSRGFDVTEQWPLRACLWRIDDNEAVVALVVHHIASDGESRLPLITDLVTAYEARAAGAVPVFAPLAVQFADYAIWQHEVLGSTSDPKSILGEQLEFWKRRLTGVPDVLELPADRPRPLVASNRGEVVRFSVPSSVADQIVSLARAHRVTPFMVSHAAFAVLLARLSNTDDIVIGTPIAGRGQEQLDRLIGMFVNTLVLRTHVDPNQAFAELLSRVRSTDLDAFAHADVPFEALVEAVDPVRSEAFSPLVQVIFSFDPAASATSAGVEVAGLSVTPIQSTDVPAQLDLNVTLSTAGPGEDWSGVIVGAADLFDAGSLALMGDRFVALLGALTGDPSLAVGDGSWLLPGECDRVLAVGCGSERSRSVSSLVDAVDEQVGLVPDAVALVFEGRSVSYAEFGARVAVLARELIAVGVGPDVPVGVCIDRSVEMVVGIQAVLVAGGQYVPIDVGAPVDRVEYMVVTAGVGLVLVAAGEPVSEALVALEDRVALWPVDASGEVGVDVEPVAVAERRGVLRPESAAYTLFTSGSTGRPKGVTVSHGAVGNFLAWFDGLVDLPAGQRLLFKTPYTFDASVLELFWPLVFGQTMVIASPEGHRDPAYLAQVMVRERVSVVQFVPSLLSVFLETVPGGEAFASVERVFCGGEALSPAVYRRLVERVPGLSVVNLFGPTECAVYTESAVLRGDSAVVPIGVPMPNTSALVLDGRLRPVPVGVAGELYLGGVQSARGYVSRSGLTAERFVADPFGGSGARMYRTGDLVRWNSAGELEYLGRSDFQVKLRGQRIELGEIEAVLVSVPGVVHAAAVVAGADGDESLVGYVAPLTVDLEVLGRAAAAVLPGYMVPSVWMPVDEMPLNSAGKVDRRALPEPVFGDRAREYVAPVGEVESTVVAVFSDVLGVDGVGVNDSFFELGGSSLAVVRVRARLAESGHEIELPWLFSDPTARGLANRIAGNDQSTGGVLLPLRAEGARAPLFAVHPAGGLAWFYGGLAPYLADRPIYGLQDPHVATGEESVFDARELAARYIEEIRRVQPSGPYHLLGWSLGGYVAQAMATLLQDEGESVVYLGLLDTGVPGLAPSEDSEGEPVSDEALDVLGQWRELFDIDSYITAGDADEVVAIIRQQIADMDLFAEEQVQRIMESFESARVIAESFEPQEFSGDLHVFTATADKDDPAIIAESWRPYVDGTIHNVDVDTHHLGMASQESLDVIGRAIERRLALLDDQGVRESDNKREERN
ncbi:amino acid adenylation domain-containing protein [Gordonia caeni]